MKKFLTLGVLVAALAASVGCEEKKSSPTGGKSGTVVSGGTVVGSKTP